MECIDELVACPTRKEMDVFFCLDMEDGGEDDDDAKFALT